MSLIRTDGPVETGGWREPAETLAMLGQWCHPSQDGVCDNAITVK